MKRALVNVGRWLLLSLAHVVLFTVGSQVFRPVVPGPALDASQQSAALVGLVAMGLVDSALVLAVVRNSRLRGWRLMVLIAGVFWFVKTLTSLIEAEYFMPNVSGPMLPSLLLMTLPLSVGLAPLAVWLGGRAKASDLDGAPGFAPLPMSAAEAWWKTALLSAVVYPVLFFAAGWFIAFRSEELRTFYGGAHGDTLFAHYAYVFGHDPFLFPLEVLRGALWVAAAVLLLRSTRGPWWLGTLLVALWFALVQNDVHFIPNPLMTPDIRLHHFVETASSNFVFAWCIGWLLHRSHAPARRQPHGPPAHA